MRHVTFFFSYKGFRIQCAFCTYTLSRTGHISSAQTHLWPVAHPLGSAALKQPLGRLARPLVTDSTNFILLTTWSKSNKSDRVAFRLESSTDPSYHQVISTLPGLAIKASLNLSPAHFSQATSSPSPQPYWPCLPFTQSLVH